MQTITQVNFNMKKYDLNELLKDYNPGMSDLQRNLFVVGKQGTLYGCYKQALREMFHRFDSLNQMQHDYELSKIDIEELQNDVANKNYINVYDKKRDQLKLTMKVNALTLVENSLKDLKNEIQQFYGHAI